jgi:hypothetical protein
VTFGDKSVEFGKELTPTLVKDTPTLSWSAEPSALYTICMTGKRKVVIQVFYVKCSLFLIQEI